MSITRIPIYRGRADRNPAVVAHTIVDPVDAEVARGLHLTLFQGYASYRVARPDIRKRYLHRLILGDALKPGLIADHINRDKLDNRRANLRVVTRAQNNQNRDAYRNGSSRFRGVSWDPKNRRWRATAQADGQWKWLGHYDSEEEAAAVASQWRAKHLPYSFEDAVAC